MIGFCRALQGQQNITVAGKPLREFGAKMQTYPAFSQEIDAEVFQGARRSTITPLSNRRGAKYLRCLIDFFGDNVVRTENQSAFEALFLGLQPVELDIGDGFFYRAVLTGQGETVALGEILTTVEYTFRVTRHRTSCSVSVRGYDGVLYPDAGRVFCQSNVEKTDCRITIDLPLGIVNEGVIVTINGYEWILPAPVHPETGTRLIIDGINKVFLTKTPTQSGTVTENVTNKMTWTDFPFLVPGENLLKIAVEGAPFSSPATVEYTPTFL